ncbi:MAG: M13 family metallopeptidase, partial [bacterium]
EMERKMKKSTLLCICLASLIGFSCGEKHGIDVADMDRSANPAKDFYQFANGGWLERTAIPASESRWSIGPELRDRNKEALHGLLTSLAANSHDDGSNAQKVADFYRTGMDSSKIEQSGATPIQPYFEEIDAIRNFDDVLKVTAKHQKFGSGALYGVLVEADFKNSDVSTVFAFQGGLGMPDRDYYLDKGERFVNYRKEYLKHLQKMFEIMGEDSTKAKAAASTIIEIETRLAKSSWTRVQMRNLPAMYNKRTIVQANRETPNIDWQQLFSRLGVTDLEYFVLAQPKFFQEVSAMLTAVSIDEWKTYLRWHLINATAPYMSSDFVKQDFAFFQKVLRGTKELKPRWKRVAETTDAAIGEALGQLYVEKYFPLEAKTKANQMVTDLREAYRHRIEKLDWMSAETKKNAFAKLEKMVQKIGYPDIWRDYSALEIKRDAYVLNVIRANEFEFDRNMKKIGRPVDKTEWGMTPPTVNAYFHPLNNEIVFPAGILQPPFFDPKADLAVNYGAMGAVIGHEITHGFDDQGSQFDADGNMSNWWTPEDKQRFEAKTKVVEEQFNEYTILDSVHVNGKLTLGENIADLGGLAVAYDALQIALEKNGRPGKIDGFTPEQRFFLAYATGWRVKTRDDALLNQVKTDPHSPANFRAVGPISNMPEFFDAFQVKAGDAMRRPDSTIAKIW